MRGMRFVCICRAPGRMGDVYKEVVWAYFANGVENCKVESYVYDFFMKSVVYLYNVGVCLLKNYYKNFDVSLNSSIKKYSLQYKIYRKKNS